MAALISCKHSNIEIYEDAGGRGYFGECTVCESTGPLAKTQSAARRAVKDLKTRRKSKSGGARQGAGRPKVLKGEAQLVTVNLLPPQIKKLKRLQKKQGLTGRSAAIRVVIDAFKIA